MVRLIINTTILMLGSIIMGYVLIIPLWMLLFVVIVGITVYLFVRARRRRQAAQIPMYYGPPAPPLQAQDKPN